MRNAIRVSAAVGLATLMVGCSNSAPAGGGGGTGGTPAAGSGGAGTATGGAPAAGGAGGNPQPADGAADATGGSGGAPGAGCATPGTICWDFEQGALPPGFMPYRNEFAGTLVFDQTRPHRGTYSLHTK